MNFSEINFPLCLAPMVGISHIVLKDLVLQYMPVDAVTIWPTEMLSSRRLPYEELGKTPETMKLDDEVFLVPQILGNEKKPITESIQKLKLWGAHGIDINMGCPVQKALKHNYGVALMGDPEYAHKIVKMAVEASDLPVSVKLRAVESDYQSEQLYSFVKGIFDSGASWVCLHPRTAIQKRRGKADWEQIKFLKDNFSFPIIGNGDIQIVDDVWRMQKETKCDLVMAGRALAARPWLVWQFAEELGFTRYREALVQNRSKAPRTRADEGAEYGTALKYYIEKCFIYFPEGLALRKIRFHIKLTSPWLVFGHRLMSLSTLAKSKEELIGYIDDFFNQEQEMEPYTELRQ